ncbi:hypothetical protein [Dyadobacter psychrotolerans]|uniref:Type I restriction modification DNA specificity domain-containing protein n=1 Tax=Dyadobacter psychrotolerans TaxID=2541721 RepID=A0A4R5DY99_9BACT|nr:hypothetical protein [Dyadobacter psychrotolerans]TDE17171.1 hypothetical protein E0F88_04540 [Dyadobacter psychrotolerans]
MENFAASFYQTLNRIAKDFTMTELENVATIVTGCAYQVSDYASDEMSSVTVIEHFAGKELVFGEDKFMRITEREIMKYKFRTGDIVFSHRNSEKGLGKTVLFDSAKTVIHTSRYLRIRPADDYDSTFLALLLDVYRQTGYLHRLAKGNANLLAINVSSLKDLKVPLIADEQQQAVLTKMGRGSFQDY